MRVLGIVLIVLGILALVYKGITYKKEEKVFDVGPIEARVNEKKTMPISPIVGGILLASGVILVLVDRRPNNP